MDEIYIVKDDVSCYDCGGFGQIRRIYTTELEADVFAERFNECREPFDDPVIVQPFKIGAPDVEYDGPVWRWHFALTFSAASHSAYPVKRWHSGEMPPEFKVIREGVASFECWGTSLELVNQYGNGTIERMKTEAEERKRYREEYRAKHGEPFGGHEFG